MQHFPKIYKQMINFVLFDIFLEIMPRPTPTTNGFDDFQFTMFQPTVSPN